MFENLIESKPKKVRTWKQQAVSVILHVVIGYAAIYVLFGLGLFAGAFWVTARVAPFSIRKEIEEDHNTALAIILGAGILGIAIIVAAAIT